MIGRFGQREHDGQRGQRIQHAGGLRQHVDRHQRADGGHHLVDSIHIRMSRVRLERKKAIEHAAGTAMMSSQDRRAEVGDQRVARVQQVVAAALHPPKFSIVGSKMKSGGT